jgi:hypothetical protein
MASSNNRAGASLALAILLSALCTVASAVEFAGGTGESDDPYQIATAEQLIAIGADPNLYDRHFVLVADIDLAPGQPGGQVFTGSVIPYLSVSEDGWRPWLGFAGSLDGAGHTIKNLTIAMQQGGCVGLFTQIAAPGRVSNLVLRPVSIDCPSGGTAGALAGENQGTILNCRVNGYISAATAGGLLGRNSGTIRACSADCWVAGRESAGGLVGVHTTATTTGGLASVIEYCMAEGTVTATAMGRVYYGVAGGLVGSSYATVSNCYATTFVTGDTRTGGLIGSCNGNVTCCYACGQVNGPRGDPTIGGLIGYVWMPELTRIEASYFLNPLGSPSQVNGLGTALTDAQMRQAGSFAGWDFAGPVTDGFAEVWTMPEDGGYPVLSVLSGHEPPRPPGSGTEDDPYQLSRLEDLPTMVWNPEAHYRLVADINFADLPVVGPVVSSFKGRLDGAGHSLVSLHVTSKEGGFFGKIELGAVVENLRLDNASLEAMPGVTCLGTLAGMNLGLVRNCRVAGAVTGTESLGGLVGANNGVLWACSADVQATGSRYVGGLAGQNSSGVIACAYTRGSAQGTSYCGGLVGFNSAGIIWQCYSTCQVAPPASTTPSSTLGGLVGTDYARQIYDSYYLAPPAGSPGANGLGTALSEAQLRDPASFAGWDFFGDALDGTRDIWFIEQGAYPVLSCETEQTPLGLAVCVRGQSLEDATAHIAAAGQSLGEVRYDFDGAIPANHVIGVQAGSNSAVDLLVSIGPYSWTDNAGDGTATNPYQIATAGQLDCLGYDPSLWDRCFILVQDIDLSGREYSGPVLAPDLDQPTSEFQGVAFTGSFDGRGHTIRGLTIVSSQTYVGLFGCIGASGAVSGLSLQNALITGDADTYADASVGGRCGTAALAGENAGTVTDCHCDGIILGTQETGGLIGDNKGTVVRCSAAGKVYGTSYVGGLVGINRADVAESWADARVFGNTPVGGLAGSSTSRIERCFAAGQAQGASYVGGLTGQNSGTVADCFSTACVQSELVRTSYPGMGGLVGSNSGAINRSYSIGPVQNPQGGLVGTNTAAVNQSFWDTQTSGAPGSSGGAGRTTGQMHQAATFIGWGDVWVIEEGIGYPQLAWTGAAGTPLQNLPARSYRGSGKPTDPFILATPQELVCFLIRAEDWSGEVELACDIDMAGVQTRSTIGTFTGTLDGKGHRIRNLTLSGTGGSLALVDRLQGGTIRNVQLIDVQIDGAGSYVAGLAAWTSKATVSCCRVTGRIVAGDGAQCVGGLLGYVSETAVSCCGAEIEITTGGQCQYVGGLVGYTYKGAIRNCYARGAVAAADACKYVGGLVGAIGYDTALERCYAAVHVTMADGTSGGISGSNLSDTYCSTNVFWDKEVSPDSKGCGGHTTATMQAAVLYLSAGWDFAFEINWTADIWVMPAGGGYPELICFVGIPEPASLPGSGTAEDPYRIASVEDLLAIQRLDSSACYLLCKDLDFGGRTVTGAPVPRLLGQFLGNGHTISDLHVAGDYALGVFGEINTTATVADLNVEDVNVAGAASSSYIGALAGRNWGKVINCRVTGVVTGGDDSSYVSGLIGYNLGPLIDCRANVQVAVGHRCRYIGGLAGQNEGPVKSCQVSVDLQAGDSASGVGGLIGRSYGDLFLCECTGHIWAGQRATAVGGLAGLWPLAYDIIDCRADIGITGLADCNGVGGLAGDFVGRISQCYARGTIALGENASNAGALAGRRRSGTLVLGSFWCVEGAMTSTAGGQEITPAETRDPNQFLNAGWDFVGEQANGTADLWLMPPDANGPRLAVFTPGYQKPLLPGKGTAEDPYLIATPQDLGAVNHQDLWASFRLTAEMDLSAIRWSESPFWLLLGSFDGGGFTITGLRIPRAARPGLFRWVHTDVEVKTLTITDANVVGGAILTCLNNGRLTDCHVSGQVSGTGSIGGLAGYNARDGVILRCSSAANVTGIGYLGGLVGDNSGRVEQCFATGNVSGQGAGGGLVGRHYNYDRPIQDCYARGSVNIQGYGGGLVGLTTKTVKNCYATGAVSGQGELGGLVDVDDLRKTTNCFWDTQTSGMTSSVSGVGKTTSQMHQAATFTGWDFANVWMICEGKDYPRLRWEGIQCSE